MADKTKKKVKRSAADKYDMSQTGTDRLIIWLAIQRYYKAEQRRGTMVKYIHHKVNYIQPCALATMNIWVRNPVAQELIRRGVNVQEQKIKERIDYVIESIRSSETAALEYYRR